MHETSAPTIAGKSAFIRPRSTGPRLVLLVIRSEQLCADQLSMVRDMPTTMVVTG